jgi:hypothetical protein
MSRSARSSCRVEATDLKGTSSVHINHGTHDFIEESDASPRKRVPCTYREEKPAQLRLRQSGAILKVDKMKLVSASLHTCKLPDGSTIKYARTVHSNGWQSISRSLLLHRLGAAERSLLKGRNNAP